MMESFSTTNFRMFLLLLLVLLVRYLLLGRVGKHLVMRHVLTTKIDGLLTQPTIDKMLKGEK